MSRTAMDAKVRRLESGEDFLTHVKKIESLDNRDVEEIQAVVERIDDVGGLVYGETPASGDERKMWEARKRLRLRLRWLKSRVA